MFYPFFLCNEESLTYRSFAQLISIVPLDDADKDRQYILMARQLFSFRQAYTVLKISAVLFNETNERESASIFCHKNISISLNIESA